MSESTGKRVARIAARIVALDVNHLIIITKRNVKAPTWEEIQAVAASCLNQAPDKPKKLVFGYPEPKKKIKLGRYRTRNPKGLKRPRKARA